jgi:hypothetical protein
MGNALAAYSTLSFSFALTGQQHFSTDTVLVVKWQSAVVSRCWDPYNSISIRSQELYHAVGHVKPLSLSDRKDHSCHLLPALEARESYSPLRQPVSTWTRCGERLAPRRANEGYTAELFVPARLAWSAYHRHPGCTGRSMPHPDASTHSLRMPAELALSFPNLQEALCASHSCACGVKKRQAPLRTKTAVRSPRAVQPVRLLRLHLSSQADSLDRRRTPVWTPHRRYAPVCERRPCSRLSWACEARTQPFIVGFDGGIKTCRGPRRHIQLRSGSCVPAMANLRSTPHTCSAAPDHGSKAHIVHSGLSRLTEGKVEGGDHQPAGRAATQYLGWLLRAQSPLSTWYPPHPQLSLSIPPECFPETCWLTCTSSRISLSSSVIS